MADLTKKDLNNEIEAIEKKLKKAQVCIIHKLIKNQSRISNGKEPQGEENLFTPAATKKSRILQEIFQLKKLSIRDAAKFSLTNTKSFAQVAGNVEGTERAIMRVVDHQSVKEAVASFRIKYPKWETQVPSLYSMWDFQRNVLKKLPKNECKRRAKAKTALMSEIKRTPYSSGRPNPAKKLEPRVETRTNELSRPDPKVEHPPTEDSDGEDGFEENFQYASQCLVRGDDNETSDHVEENETVTDNDLSDMVEDQNDDESSLESGTEMIVSKSTPNVQKHSLLNTEPKISDARPQLKNSTKKLKAQEEKGGDPEGHPIFAADEELEKKVEPCITSGHLISVNSVSKSMSEGDGSDSESNDETVVDADDSAVPQDSEKKVSDLPDGNNPQTVVRKKAKPKIHARLRKSTKKSKTEEAKAKANEMRRTPLEMEIARKAKEKLGETLRKLAHNTTMQSLTEPKRFPISKITKGQGDTEIMRVDMDDMSDGEIRTTTKSSKKKRKKKKTAEGKLEGVPKVLSFGSFFVSVENGRCYSDEEEPAAKLEDGGQAKPKNLLRDRFSQKKKKSESHFVSNIDDEDDDADDEEDFHKNSSKSAKSQKLPSAPVKHFKKGNSADVSELDQPAKPKIHPSWEAKKQLRNTGVSLACQGRKFYFGDDATDEAAVEPPNNFADRPDRVNKRKFERTNDVPNFEKTNTPKLHPSCEAKKMQRNAGLSLARQGKKMYFHGNTTVEEAAAREPQAAEQPRAPKLHPSWEAKKKQHDTGISLAHQGKKMYFGNDVGGEGDVKFNAEDKARSYSDGIRFQSAKSRISSSTNGSATESFGNKSAPEKLHPSWEAKMMQRNTGISLAQQGKKCYFDES